MHEFIIFATADWREPYWTNKQHTAKSFAELGNKVLYIESVGLRAPKLSSKKDVSRILNRLKSGLKTLLFGAEKLEDGIWVLAPLLIPAAHRYPLIRRFNKVLMRWLIQRHCQKYNFNNRIVWTYHPYMLDTISGLDYQKLVYHCVDDLSSVPGIDKGYFLQQEIKLLTLADQVFTTTQSLQKRCQQYQEKSDYLSNVVDFEHFSQALTPLPEPEDIRAIPRPRVVYHGVLSDFKVDFSLLLKLAENCSDLNFVLLGNEREGQNDETFSQLKALPNVYALGYRHYHVLPNYLAHMDVAMLPTMINEYTHFMFPMKYYEYLAAGIPVVSTALKFTQSVSYGIYVVHSVDEFSSSLGKAIAHGRFTLEQAKNFVGDNTWRARTAKMLESIDTGVSD